MNSVHRYELELQNRGDIECVYALKETDTQFGPKFAFTPSEGVLAVGDTHNIEVVFASEILGEFSEHFDLGVQPVVPRLEPLQLLAHVRLRLARSCRCFLLRTERVAVSLGKLSRFAPCRLDLSLELSDCCLVSTAPLFGGFQ